MPGGGVLKDDQARIVGGTGGDGGERAHAEGNDVLAFEHFAVHVVASGELAGFFRHVFRREAVGRGVGEVAGEDDGFGMGLAAPGGKAGEVRHVGVAEQEGQPARIGVFGLFGLERLVAPQAEHGGADDFFNGALDIGVEAGQTGNGEGERVHAKFAAADGCGPGALADLLKRFRIRQRVEFAEADHDGAGQRVCGRAVEEAHFAFFPVEVAHPRRDGHPRRGVQQFGVGFFQFLVFRQEHDHRVRRPTFRPSGLKTQFHCKRSFGKRHWGRERKTPRERAFLSPP